MSCVVFLCLSFGRGSRTIGIFGIRSCELACATNLWENLKQMAASLNSETGTELLSRLTTQKIIEVLEPDLFGKTSPGDVIEILGDSNCGKTELLYHLCTKAIFPPFWKGTELNGLEIGVLFIDTDQKFSVIRLMTILEKRLSDAIASTNQQHSSNNDIMEFLKTCLSRINVIICKSMDELIITLHGLDEIQSSQDKLISLILIDSVSAFYWADKMTYMSQPKAFYEYYAKFSKITQEALNTFKMVLVATKQLLVQSNNPSEKDYDFMGRAWEKLVTKRLKLCSKIEGNLTNIEINQHFDDTPVIRNARINTCGLKLIN